MRTQQLLLPSTFEKGVITSLLAHLFLSISNIHIHFKVLQIVKPELLFFVSSFSFAGIWFCMVRQLPISITKGYGALFLVISFFMLIDFQYPANESSNLLALGEFKTYTKTILLIPLFTFFFNNQQRKDLLIKVFRVSAVVLGMVFIYRYLVLGEVRTFDLRPVIGIRIGDPNFLSMIFLITLFIGPLRQKAVAPVTIFESLFLILCLFMTQSRMGIIGLFIGLIALFGKKITEKPVLLVLFILLIISPIFLSEDLQSRFLNIFDKSNMDRFKTWELGLILFSKNPIWGVGFDRSAGYFFQLTGYPMFLSQNGALTIHNTPLKLLAETGVIGITIFLYAFKQIFIQLRQTSREFLLPFFLFIFCIQFIGIWNKDFFLFTILIFTIVSLKNRSLLEFSKS